MPNDQWSDAANRTKQRFTDQAIARAEQASPEAHQRFTEAQEQLNKAAAARKAWQPGDSRLVGLTLGHELARASRQMEAAIADVAGETMSRNEVHTTVHEAVERLLSAPATTTNEGAVS